MGHRQGFPLAKEKSHTGQDPLTSMWVPTMSSSRTLSLLLWKNESSWGFPVYKKHKSCPFLAWCLNCHIGPLFASNIVWKNPVPSWPPPVLPVKPGPLTLVNIPALYQEFSEVFTKAWAMGLLPHRPYGCTIDLFTDSTPPQGQIYPLSFPEQWAVEEYLQEALQQGYIYHSTSPASAGFFFVEKKRTQEDSDLA